MVQSFEEVAVHGRPPRHQHADRRLHAGDRAGGGGAPAPRDVCVRAGQRGSGTSPAAPLRVEIADRRSGQAPALLPGGLRRLRPPPQALRHLPGARGARGEPGADGGGASGSRKRTGSEPGSPKAPIVVALARVGAGWTSADLARQLERWLLAARPLTFVIGGSHGLDSSTGFPSRGHLEPRSSHPPARVGPGRGRWSSSIGRSRFCGGSRTIRGLGAMSCELWASPVRPSVTYWLSHAPRL